MVRHVSCCVFLDPHGLPLLLIFLLAIGDAKSEKQCRYTAALEPELPGLRLQQTHQQAELARAGDKLQGLQ